MNNEATLVCCMVKWWKILINQGKLPPSVREVSANTRRRPNVVLILAHRRRRWANINTTFGDRFVFPGLCPVMCGDLYGPSIH